MQPKRRTKWWAAGVIYNIRASVFFSAISEWDWVHSDLEQDKKSFCGCIFGK
jgi:hypothetical protein